MNMWTHLLGHGTPEVRMICNLAFVFETYVIYWQCHRFDKIDWPQKWRSLHIHQSCPNWHIFDFLSDTPYIEGAIDQ